MDDNNALIQQDPVYALAATSTAYFAARMSGLYRSQDGGSTWQDIYTSLETPQPLTTTAVIADGSLVFAGVNGAILRSYDAGENWHIAGLPAPPPLVVALAMSPNFAEDGALMAGTAEDGVFVSTDRGIYWTPWNFGLIDLNIYSVAFSPYFAENQTIFVGTESGIFRSKNGGRAWREIPFPMDAAPVLSLCMLPLSASESLILAGTDSSGLFISSDSGQTWQQVDEKLISTAINAIRITMPPTPRIWLLLENRLLYSTDRGQSWQQHAIFPDDKLAMTMTFDPQQDCVLVGFADGRITPIKWSEEVSPSTIKR